MKTGEKSRLVEMFFMVYRIKWPFEVLNLAPML
jgi:hypothetical protein